MKIKIIILLLLCSLPYWVYADPTPPIIDTTTNVPIDGGVAFAAAAGLAYATKVLRNKKNKKDNN
jgi:hypothetical protein